MTGYATVVWSSMSIGTGTGCKKTALIDSSIY